MKFSRDIQIRFQHCDPAGIVFYPRYFEMFNQVVEDWFAEALDMPFQNIHQRTMIGVPVVHIDCDFLSASRIGDVVTFTLSVTRIGTKSFRLTIAGGVDDEIRLKATLTLACVTLGEQLHGAPIPSKMRAAMEPFLESA